MWFVDFDPVRGREPALVVSSRFHLDLTANQLVSVLPLTSVERPGRVHRVQVGSAAGWVITEQVRTVSAPTDSGGTHPKSRSQPTNWTTYDTC